MARKSEENDRIDMIVGNKIRELRMAMGMSRHELAAKIEVTHQQIQKYEKGINRVSAGRLVSIAKVLGKPLHYFVTTDNESDAPLPTHHQRMCIELTRNFMRIQNSAYQEAISTLVRTIAEGNPLGSDILPKTPSLKK